ncbi:MAG: hydrogenase maturation nickel metallochaperone HypA [Phycisphaerales bacterium]|nr:MAG: hydrogenase maturation nickel metallochaperone HypA [Phycisphaerales bacterium]
MHEGAIAEALLEQVRSFLPDQAVLREVHIDVGRLEHLEEMVLQTFWAALTKGTGEEGSLLSVNVIALQVRCRGCGMEYEPEDPAIMLCPQCGAARPEILQGSGVVLRRMEVEQPD